MFLGIGDHGKVVADLPRPTTRAVGIAETDDQRGRVGGRETIASRVQLSGGERNCLDRNRAARSSSYRVGWGYSDQNMRFFRHFFNFLKNFEKILYWLASYIS